ncbi:uncharacterized protein LOC128985151 [Macrosteles quadrilineatus]|uniref:uncharacterized protein LOC128985151 n=1 Tax=Macrosteles quadrilineatus TaxID=74068 RepID=UPI0023E09239|nr:uncharacterized protein LOC128985151 [Macrosteles quadrilineatus]
MGLMYCVNLLLHIAIIFIFVSEVTSERPLQQALLLGMSQQNMSREDCIWRRGGERDQCPDPNIFYYLYIPNRTEDGDGRPHIERVDLHSPRWLHSSHYDPALDTVVLIHGYAGVTDVLPVGVLRDAYLKNGGYNVFVVDWGELAAIPCYPAAVHNLRPVSRCVAQFLAFLRDSGVPVGRTTCVGHSLGAHVCGIAANYLLFRMHRIIGLDPARPLIRPQNKNRLDAGDAEVVQVIHTSSTFGDTRRSGHIDICVNGGRAQPFCHNTTNEQLCSHIRSVCYMAESLDPGTARVAVPCTRRCHGGDRVQDWKRHAPPVFIGQMTPDSATGMFCVNNEEPPYCPRRRGDSGSPLCCVPPSVTPVYEEDETTTEPPTTIEPTTTQEPVATDFVRTYTINPLATRLPGLAENMNHFYDRFSTMLEALSETPCTEVKEEKIERYRLTHARLVTCVRLMDDTFGTWIGFVYVTTSCDVLSASDKGQYCVCQRSRPCRCEQGDYYKGDLLKVPIDWIFADASTEEYYRLDWSIRTCRLRLYESCDENSDILYYLYSREDDPPAVLNGSFRSLPQGYDETLPLKVLIHGFAGRILTDPTSDIRKEYMKAGGYNVLAVDWGRLALLPCYPSATLNTIEVGRCLGELLLRMSPTHPPSQLHIIGFSLGAHIAAFTANYVQAHSGQRVARITGLDPALPFFATLKDSWKLDKEDAIFVDVIHTNTGLFGKIEPTGHIDFYVNDGTLQPGCTEHRNPPLCSHMLANTYFAESITSTVGFYGTSCPNYFQYTLGWCPLTNKYHPAARSRILMGEKVIFGARGLYIVQTGSAPPYALG